MQVILTNLGNWKNIVLKIPVIAKKKIRKKKYQTMTLKRQDKN